MTELVSTTFLGILGVIALALIIWLALFTGGDKMVSRKKEVMVFFGVILGVFGLIFLNMAGNDIGVPFATVLLIIAATLIIYALVRPEGLEARKYIGVKKHNAMLISGVVMIGLGLALNTYANQMDLFKEIVFAIIGGGLLIVWFAFVSYSRKEKVEIITP